MKLDLSTIQNLEAQYGDSFYILDLNNFKRNYFDFQDAFRRHYPNTHIAYSYKTNLIPLICKKVNSWNGYAEVVSWLEYDLAVKVGMRPEKIIFNGPYKRKVDLDRALTSGAIVNLGSNYEVEFVRQIADAHPEKSLKIGLRCNLDLEGESRSRFGFDCNDIELEHIIRKLKSINNITIAGLHCHQMLSDRSSESYSKLLSGLLRLTRKHFSDDSLEFIDIGGGFYSRMPKELADQFETMIPSFNDYGSSIGILMESSFRSEYKPKLILEPGLALIADCMIFICKVLDIKKIDNKFLAITSGSVFNTNPTKSAKNLPVKVIKANSSGQSRFSDLDITGYTCLEEDILYRCFKGKIGIGDYLIFYNTGAYTLPLKPPFILPCPAVIAFDGVSGEFKVVKRGETFEDFFRTYED